MYNILLLMNNIDFVHITKTGGTSIENWGLQNNINWGYNKKDIFEKGRYSIDWKGGRANDKESWHIPPRCFINNRRYPYKNTTFMVVRNPYSRIISEYYCPWVGSDYMQQHNINEFNSWINKFLKNQGYGAHGIPQSYYKPVDYILHLENLDKEFSVFINSIDPSLPTVLPHINQSDVTKNKFSVKDISRENINLINQIYSEDFDSFGYKKL